MLFTGQLNEATFFAGFYWETLQVVLPFSCFPLLCHVKLINTMFSNRVGIIGAHCSELNSFLLQSDGTMEEEEQEQDREQREEQEKPRTHSFVLTKDLSLSAL